MLSCDKTFALSCNIGVRFVLCAVCAMCLVCIALCAPIFVTLVCALPCVSRLLELGRVLGA